MKQFLKGNVRMPLLRDALWKNRNFLVIFTLTLFLCFPVPMLLDLYYDGINLSAAFIPEMMIGMYIATIVILLVIPFFFFNYLTKKRSVDFIHSLPISRSDLFVTYSLASFLMVLIPFTLTYWTGMIISYFTHMNGFQIVDVIYFIRAILIFGAIQIPTIFVIMNTGTLSDSVIFSFILFIAPFVAYIAISDFTSSYLLGFTNLSTTNMLMYISPSVFLVTTIIPSLTALDINVLNLYWFIFALAGYIVSCAMYRHWKSEFSERPFNNDYFYPFVTSLFTGFLFIFMMALFSINRNAPLKFLSLQNLILPLLFTYVFYVILDFIKQRSTKYFFRATKHYTYIIIFALSLSTIVFTTQGFGYAWNVPDAKETQSVTVELTSYNGSSNGSQLKIEDPNEINAIINIHQDMVDQFREANKFFSDNTIGYDNDIGRVTFDYRSKDNSKLKRTFNIPSELFVQLHELEQIPSVAIHNSKFLLGKDVRNVRLDSTLAELQYKPNESDIEILRSAYIEDLKDNQSKTPSQEDYRLQYVMTYDSFYDEKLQDSIIEERLFIDNRFTKTLEVIQTFELSNHQLDYYIAKDFYLNNTHSITGGINYWNIEDGSVPISFTEAVKHSGSIYTFSATKSIESLILVARPGEGYENNQITLPVFE